MVLLLINPSYASEEVLIASRSIGVGEEFELPIALSTAPNGLAGYEISVHVEDPRVAEIVDVRFPGWAKLTDSSVKSDSASLKAVDLDDQIKAGENNIDLATLKLKATRVGETTIKLAIIKMDDDEGNPITPSAKQAKLTVTATKQTQPPWEIYAGVVIAAIAASITSLIYRRRRKSRVVSQQPVKTLIASIQIIVKKGGFRDGC